jgi:hypothetical protein
LTRSKSSGGVDQGNCGDELHGICIYSQGEISDVLEFVTTSLVVGGSNNYFGKACFLTHLVASCCGAQPKP